MKTTISLIAVTLMLASCTSSKTNVQAPAPKGANANPNTNPNTNTPSTPQGGLGTPPPVQSADNGTSGGQINGSANAATTPAADDASKINAGRDTSTGTTTTATGGTTAAAGTATAHAPYSAAPAGYSLTNVTTWVAAHKAAHPGYKYVYIPPENAADKDMANVLRLAAAKAWNHLSWKVDLDIPEDISGGAGLAFALNAPKIWGNDAEKNWGFIANCTPKGNIQISPAPRGACKSFSANDPVSIPRFVFNATNGGPYANVHGTPTDFQDFTRTFNLGQVKYVATHHDAIVCGPRISAYRPVHLNGANVDTWYSFTTDEFDGRDNGNINYQQAPTDRDQRQTGSFRAASGDDGTAVASEWWMQLPNGFMYWGIHGEGAQERGKAEFPFAIDPANWAQNDELATGRSCITCHANGIQSAKSDEDKAGKNGWTSNEDLNAFYAIVRGKFQGAMKTLTSALSDGNEDLNNRLVTGTIEPIAKAIMLIEGPYQGGNDCSYFCNGKYGPQRQNLCETMPTRK